MAKKKNKPVSIVLTTEQMRILCSLPHPEIVLNALLPFSQTGELPECDSLTEALCKPIMDESLRIDALVSKRTAIVTTDDRSMEDRATEFATLLSPYIGTGEGQYPESFIRDFYDYWTQPYKGGKKMLFEHARDTRAFVINLRLATSWKMFGCKNHGGATGSYEKEGKGDRNRRVYEEMMAEINGNYGTGSDNSRGESAACIENR